jgi:hypothetical protein
VDAREDFHQFVEELDDELVKPSLHAVIDSLPDHAVAVALQRIRALRADYSIQPLNNEAICSRVSPGSEPV